MLKRIVMLVALGVLLAVVPLAGAQEDEAPVIVINADVADAENPDAVISYPPSVYVVRDRVELRGTANVAGMSNYFIEFTSLALNPDLSSSSGWIPAVLPTSRPVIDDVLGEWDTRALPDGLYALRLSVNVTGDERVQYIVSPIRVENDLPPFLAAQMTATASGSVVVSPIVATPTGGIITRPTLAATPTPAISGPSVTSTTDANVRRGDSLSYDVIGSLLAGDSAAILGRSPNGWYYIQLENGRRGFISPSVVTTSGNLSNLQVITPPATPTPTFTPTPPPSGNLLINGHGLVPSPVECNVPFEIQVNVTNNGTTRTSGAAVVTMQDFHKDSGTLVATQSNTIPPLDPGQNFVVTFNLNLGPGAFPRTDHRVVITVDSLNQVIEQNEGDNVYTFEYRLRGGACP